MTKGLVGSKPVTALRGVIGAPVTAELRKQSEGAVAQTDEDDLGFSYEQSDYVETKLLTGRQTPLQVYEQMKGHKLFGDDKIKMQQILIKFCKRWEGAHFKRIMAVLAPYLGRNVDPHQSVRTTVIGDHFRTFCAQMSLHVIGELVGEGEFQKRFGMSVAEAEIAAMLNRDFKSALITWPMDKLTDAANWKQFGNANSFILKYAGPNAISACPPPQMFLDRAAKARIQ
jgi:hypothetical protein